MKLKLWKISQDFRRGYDTYDAAVVSAYTEEEARRVEIGSCSSWCPPEYVKVEYLGKATKGIEPGIILTSFHAG